MQHIGFLGCGRVAQHYAQFFTGGQINNATVTAVCDSVKGRADAMAQKLNAVAVHDHWELLRRDDVDIVFVLSESGKHGDHAYQALCAGKHVMVEKPAALLPEEIYRNEALAKERGLMYAVVKQNRLNPAMVALKEAYDADRFGKLVLGTVRIRWCREQEYYNDGWHGTWCMDGGVINQQAIHHIDALQWICGPVKEVVAAQANRMNSLEAEDTTVALVRFENGTLGAIEATTAARPEDIEASISIVGGGGSAVVGGIALNLITEWNFIETQYSDETIKQRASQDVPTGYGLSHGPYIQQVIDALEARSIVPPVTGSSAAASVHLVHALYASQESGTWVALADKPLSRHLGRKDGYVN